MFQSISETHKASLYMDLYNENNGNVLDSEKLACIENASEPYRREALMWGLEALIFPVIISKTCLLAGQGIRYSQRKHDQNVQDFQIYTSALLQNSLVVAQLTKQSHQIEEHGKTGHFQIHAPFHPYSNPWRRLRAGFGQQSNVRGIANDRELSWESFKWAGGEEQS